MISDDWLGSAANLPRPRPDQAQAWLLLRLVNTKPVVRKVSFSESELNCLQCRITIDHVHGQQSVACVLLIK